MSEDFEPKIVAFVCNWCTYLAADLAGTNRLLNDLEPDLFTSCLYVHLDLATRRARLASAKVLEQNPVLANIRMLEALPPGSTVEVRGELIPYSVKDAVRAALDMGLRVPEDVSVMGFDNQTIAPSEYTGPPITSVAQPLYEIGYDSIVLLSDYLRGDRRERISRTYPTSIAVKETVAFCGKEGFDKELGGVPSAVWVGSDSRE